MTPSFISVLRNNGQAHLSAILSACIWLSFSLASPAGIAQTAQPAPQATAPVATTQSKDVVESGETVSLNFNNADIDAVVRAIGKISGRNFIIDPRVKGTINIVTSRPVNRTLVYPILLSALRLQGYAVVESGNVSKVVPEADAKLHAVPSGKNASPAAGGDRIVSEVFQIKHESATQLVQVIRPLVTANNTVSVYPGNNSLVVTDYAENINRIRRIIESIDVPQGDAQVVQISNASAVDMATMLTKLFTEAGNTEASQRVSIVADPRSNSLLVRSDNRSRIQAVRSMIMQLDQSGTLGNLRVVYLKNGDATKIAQSLRALATNDTSQGGATSGQRTPTASAQASSTGTAPGAAAASGTPASFGSSVSGAYIYADTSTNSLLINASDSMYNSLRGIIEQLDRRPAQIYVEALIAEVSADRASEFGIQWNSAVPGKGTSIFGGTNFGGTGQNIFSISQNPGSAGNGLNIAVGGGTVNIPGIGPIVNIAALVRALEQDTDSNVLSTPSLVTVDNEEAKIVVGKNLPFVTGSFTNSANGASNPFQTIERKDVGLTLKIRPQITEGGTIRMLISQEASSVLSTDATLGPTTSKRSLDSTVIVDDGAFLALGGLVEDSYSGGVQKVPLLGDIPYLGVLFRYDSRKRSKTNLVIFLRPVILRSPEDSNSITGSRYDYIIGQQKASVTDGLLDTGPKQPSLPLRLDPTIKLPTTGTMDTTPSVPIPLPARPFQ
ncbi:type II secretion system secretin GspD [Uliginosibacterium sp. H3]|uniref:Type II secretion system secretin GspD n=1 Tax=Uliginosibacterium silvisoli TaxID=3114758 RepID=A0ABU6KAV0_9RHOO|nr:type II secretion system secretin GspD [Uliginosibacterium sp. H3]